jgi:hypothetical protein
VCSSPDGCSSTDHPRSATGALEPLGSYGPREALPAATEPSLMHCHRQRQALEESAESACGGAFGATDSSAKRTRTRRSGRVGEGPTFEQGEGISVD